MAKISFYGGWIDLKSLNKEDKKNYKLSMLFFLLGAFCWGIHLSGTDIGLLASNNKNITSTTFTLVRVSIVVLWLIAVMYYMKFYKTQDELFKRYQEYTLSWGALSFIALGLVISLLSPYFAFNPSFYEFSLAFVVGAIIGGYRFHKEYLS